MKQFLWISIAAGLILLSCSSPENLTPQVDKPIRLPGMPATSETVDISEPDGLIGVDPENTSGSFQLLDSTGVVKIKPNQE